jgi:hypothetical protein
MTYVCSMGMQEEQSVNAERVERRGAPRIPFRLSVIMKILPPPGRESETVRRVHVLGNDLSTSGISLIYVKPLEVGQKLELEMPGKIRAAVVRCVESQERGHYLIGCQFIDTDFAQ